MGDNHRPKRFGYPMHSEPKSFTSGWRQIRSDTAGADIFRRRESRSVTHRPKPGRCAEATENCGRRRESQSETVSRGRIPRPWARGMAASSERERSSRNDNRKVEGARYSDAKSIGAAWESASSVECFISSIGRAIDFKSVCCRFKSGVVRPQAKDFPRR